LWIITGLGSISSDQDYTWTEKFQSPLISGGQATRDGHGSTVPELTPADICVFHSDRNSKFCEKMDTDRSHFSISAVAGRLGQIKFFLLFEIKLELKLELTQL